MEKYLKNTAQLVKTLNVRNERDYHNLVWHFRILSLESLKWILQENDVEKILAKLKSI